MPTPTDLVTDLPADFEVFGQAVDTSLADLKGGTTGQVLSKTTNADMDFTWVSANPGDITEVTVSSPITGGGSSGSVNVAIQDGTTAQKGAVQLENSTSSTSTTTAAVPAAVKTSYDLAAAAIPKSTGTTAGDVIYYSGASTPVRLGVGTAGQVLTVNSGATAPEWASAASGGGMTLLASGSIAASATGFDLTSISGSYNELWLYIDDLSANAAGGIGYGALLKLNNDSGNNYSATGTQGSGTIYNNGIGYFLLVPLEDATDKHSILVRLPNYTNTTSSKIIQFAGHAYTASEPRGMTGIWTATPAAINRLTLTIPVGAFDDGTYKLYGVK